MAFQHLGFISETFIRKQDVHAPNLRWTVTDTDISPTEQFLIYSSITPEVHLVRRLGFAKPCDFPPTGTPKRGVHLLKLASEVSLHIAHQSEQANMPFTHIQRSCCKGPIRHHSPRTREYGSTLCLL